MLLGPLSLPSGLEVQERGHSQGVQTATRMSLDGRVVHWRSPVLRRLTLVAGDDHGWLSQQQVQDLRALAVATPVQPVLLHHPLLTADVSVVFDHSQGAAVELSPLFAGALFYQGVIRLMLI